MNTHVYIRSSFLRELEPMATEASRPQGFKRHQAAAGASLRVCRGLKQPGSTTAGCCSRSALDVQAGGNASRLVHDGSVARLTSFIHPLVCLPSSHHRFLVGSPSSAALSGRRWPVLRCRLHLPRVQSMRVPGTWCSLVPVHGFILGAEPF